MTPQPQQFYQPICSNISTPDIETVDKKEVEIKNEDLERKDYSSTKYSPGLAMIADEMGTLTVRKELFIPGKMYICTENFELKEVENKDKSSPPKNHPPSI